MDATLILFIVVVIVSPFALAASRNPKAPAFNEVGTRPLVGKRLFYRLFRPFPID